ncbi:MAG: hypothetical protein KDC54_13495, partial [Lewinella sp.]|nr:hypothetical protein [Lewinella sp.]
MKKLTFKLLLLSLLTVWSMTSAFTPATTTTDTPPVWEKLGQRRVNYGLDRDEILVTAAEGRFTAL